MGFRSANLAAHMMKFNSAASSDFLDLYNNIIDEEIIEKNASGGHKTFAPSQMRCDRVSWFRLRGTTPDKVKNPDATLYFTAQIGTACHEAIQRRLIEKLGGDWIPVKQWIAENPEFFKDYDMIVEEKGYETTIEIRKPYPIRFACDGIVRLNGKVYLLEIKTAEFASLNDLTAPKLKHMDQVKCYSTLLHIFDVLFLYQDRNYGELKCFEVNFTESDHRELTAKMDKVLELVDANIAPEGLPVGDPDCTPSMCKYYSVCKQWGR